MTINKQALYQLARLLRNVARDPEATPFNMNAWPTGNTVDRKGMTKGGSSYGPALLGKPACPAGYATTLFWEQGLVLCNCTPRVYFMTAKHASGHWTRGDCRGEIALQAFFGILPSKTLFVFLPSSYPNADTGSVTPVQVAQRIEWLLDDKKVADWAEPVT